MMILDGNGKRMGLHNGLYKGVMYTSTKKLFTATIYKKVFQEINLVMLKA